MNINLIQHTDMPIDIMYTACKTCYSEMNAGQLWLETHDEEKMKKLILKVLGSNHMSIAEHIYLTFTIDGISRKTSHQLVRHRHCTYSQKSQRYVAYNKPFSYSIPESIDPNKTYYIDRHGAHDIGVTYVQLMDIIQQMYNGMLEDNIPAEDARDIFPNACHTSITMSCNLREFIHICNERLCKRAQKEIRDMTALMVDCVTKEEDFQFLKEFFVPHCKTCTEFDGCKTNKEIN